MHGSDRSVVYAPCLDSLSLAYVLRPLPLHFIFLLLDPLCPESLDLAYECECRAFRDFLLEALEIACLTARGERVAIQREEPEGGREDPVEVGGNSYDRPKD